MAWILWCIDPSLLNRYIDKKRGGTFPITEWDPQCSRSLSAGGGNV